MWKKLWKKWLIAAAGYKLEDGCTAGICYVKSVGGITGGKRSRVLFAKETFGNPAARWDSPARGSGLERESKGKRINGDEAQLLILAAVVLSSGQSVVSRGVAGVQ